jgi:N,N'-diacetylchitobiose transport system permease protein
MLGAAAEAVIQRPRQSPLNWKRVRRGSTPYLLVAPVVVVLGAILAYPVYSLVRIALERYGLAELIRHHGVYIGLANFGTVLHDTVFWHTMLRTIVFAAACVSLSIVGGMLVALLLVRVSGFIRILITSGLVLVWAMPPVVAVQVWNWMTNVQNGVLNYVLTELHFGDYFQHNWFASPFSQLAMCALLIVWGAIPFASITLYAALSQVPHELVEAAQIDGAPFWRVFKDVTLPVIAPVLYILTTLSILWDFGVFTQVYLLIGQAGLTSSNYVMSVYVFEKGFVISDYGIGSAISLLMLVTVAVMSVVYVRKMLRVGEVT